MRRVLIAVLGCCCAAAAQPVENAGRIDAVTVYRGQALVTRVVDLPGGPGLREVVVGNLPNEIVPASLFAEVAGNVEIRSVRYRERPVQQDVRDEVRKLDEQIRATEDEARAGAARSALLGQRRGYLDKLEQFTATTANADLARGVLNSDTLTTLSEYLGTERAALLEAELKLAIEQRASQERLALLKRERDTVTGGSARTAREAVVFANITAAGNAAVRLRYLVNNASWQPSYNIRADAQRSSISVEYQALIQQMSGEDWNDVAITLSTATPALAARAPELSALALALAPVSAPEAQAAAALYAQKDYFDNRVELFQVQRASVDAWIGNAVGVAATQPVADPQSTAAVLNEALNKVACDVQLLDLAAGRRTTSAAPSTVGLSVSYKLAARTTAPSRADQQLINIAAVPIKATFYRVAAPVLTNYVYEEATAINTSELVLLSGPVTTYLDGQFVGQAVLPSVSAGETMKVGFGIDSSLRVDRQLLDRTDVVRGGNRVVESRYRLSVENFGNAPAALRVLERMPIAQQGQDVRIEIRDTKPAPIADYPQFEADRKSGFWRWDVEAPANVAGAKAFTIEYVLHIEHDKQLTIVGAADR